ncbi:unnamed protein product [Ectocarpus sp. CCAP 1310/34]|nr:unnamed protein product [Ectocarpus sp. CCAP 1310/34]
MASLSDRGFNALAFDPLQRLGVRELSVDVFLALVPDDSKEQSMLYRPQRLIVAAEW